MAEASRIGPGSRVLDVGCGAGDFLAYLDRLGARPAGIDPAPGMVELARARVPGAAALAELARVATPGGLVAVANWAEAGRNDLNAIEDAVAAADGDQPRPTPPNASPAAWSGCWSAAASRSSPLR